MDNSTTRVVHLTINGSQKEEGGREFFDFKIADAIVTEFDTGITKIG